MQIMIYKKTFINTETLKHAHILIRVHLSEEDERWWASLLPAANSWVYLGQVTSFHDRLNICYSSGLKRCKGTSWDELNL